MVKTPTALAEDPSKNLPAEDYEDQYAGEGTYTDERYTITPRAVILQALSPQVKKSNVAYVEGATPGMILLMNYHDPLIPGDTGIIFQPCWFETKWEVRTPRESGAANYVAEFSDPQAGWQERKPERGSYTFYTTEDGNVANEVHIHAGLVHLDEHTKLPYAIRFSGTGVFISRTFNGNISTRKTGSGKPAPRFGFLYKMRVRTQSNQVGEWGQWHITPLKKASAEDMALGHEFRRALEERRSVVDRGDEPADDMGAASRGGEDQPL
jgi:hypothetical protein